MAALCRWANKLGDIDPETVAAGDDDMRAKLHIKAAEALMAFCSHLLVALRSQSGMAGRLELQKAPRLADWAYGSGCLNCPYVIEHGGCAIYDDRPFLCRLYGTVPSLTCPHGRAPAKMLSIGEERAFMHSYLELFQSVTTK